MTTEEKLVAVAGRMFARRGYDGTSVRDITRAAGANLGAVTYYFGSKKALFGEVVFRKIAPLRDEGAAVLKSGAPPEEKMRAILTALAMHVMHNDPELRAMFVEMIGGGERLPEVAVDGIRMRNRIFAEIMKDGIRKGIFRDCDIECATWSFFGMLSAYILFHPIITGADRNGAYSKAFVERVVDCAMDVFLNGIKTGGKAGGRKR